MVQAARRRSPHPDHAVQTMFVAGKYGRTLAGSPDRATRFWWVPFAIKKADRAPTDPRPSLEERYGTHEGYVAAATAAANNAACQGYLNAGTVAAGMGATCATNLPAGVADDRAQLVNQAMQSDVLI
jgi:hypothetical protein